MAVGAELGTLQALHRTFTEKAQQANDIKTQVQSTLDSVVWTGRYSGEFKDLWVEYRVNLDRLQEALEGAAADVKANHNNIAAATGEADRI